MKARWVFGVVCVLGSAAAHPLVIDDFSFGAYAIFADAATPRVEAVRTGPGTSIIGTERDAMLDWLTGPQGASSIVLEGGGVQFLNSSSETAGMLKLQYDGIDNESEIDLQQTAGTFLNANLVGQNGFLLNFRAVNAGIATSMSMTINVVTAAGNFSNTSFVAEGTNVMHVVPFSSFSGANFAAIQRLEFTFQGPLSTDFTLESIETTVVPEPASMIVLALGAGLLLRKRKS